MPRPRDSQRAKLYRWERTEGVVRDAEVYKSEWYQDKQGGRRLRRRLVAQPGCLTLEQCRALVYRILADYGFNPEALNFPVGDGRASRKAHAGYSSMALPRWSRTLEVVCHETAHVLMARTKVGDGYAAHGPEFVRLFVDLLVKYGGYNRAKLAASAKAHGVKVATRWRA